ncbi:hypothetical protein D7Z94_17535 [Ulvibacterium marinum]|uniref:Uncharacterized protein n=2 Tax=Ulvibacterium marinum TaxID=2419782 RepID=A0A3B0C1K1_9FLAO|nr:hypothetical protein D7Z94_17535 [Ulvibacterium marinum]
MKYLLTFILIFTISCKNFENKNEAKLLTNGEMSKIRDFVKVLNTALKEYNYDFIRDSWDHGLFRKRVTNLNSTERGVFDYIYESELAKDIENANIELINQIRHSFGKMTQVKTNFVDGNHAELTYLMELDSRFYFIKYRIDIWDKKPKLSDIYFFKEDKWMSDGVKDMIRLNSRYTAMSKNRHDANRSYYNYQKALSNGDTITAFQELNNIPESHQITNDIRIARINLAAHLNDSIFNEVINRELRTNQNVYIDYLIGLYLNDSLRNMESSVKVARKIGISRKLLDSLHRKGLYWN